MQRAHSEETRPLVGCTGHSGTDAGPRAIVEGRPRRFGWTASPPDPRDSFLSFPVDDDALAVGRANAAWAADLRPQCPPVYDQRDLGGCTAAAACFLYEFDQNRRGAAAVFPPSWSFAYRMQRAMDGTDDEDSGSCLRNALKVACRIGMIPELDWPYAPERRPGEIPPPRLFLRASANRAAAYHRVRQDLGQLLACLAANVPFAFGFRARESFASQAVARTGVVPAPVPGEPVLGGLAVVAVGYDPARDAFIVRNSWGADWGDGGHFYLGRAAMLDPETVADIWTLESVVADGSRAPFAPVAARHPGPG